MLDDLAYHVGSAMPDLIGAGMAVHYHAGDTIRLWLPDSLTWIRPADSAAVGFLLVNPQRQRALIYGVRTHSEITEFASAFVRIGTVLRR